MRLLFISQWFPYPPNTGAKLRVYNLLKQLSQRHRIRLLTFTQQDDDGELIPQITPFCESIKAIPSRKFAPTCTKAILGLVSARPRSMVDLWSPEMAKLVRSEVEANPPDAIIALTLRCAEYVAGFTDIPKVLDMDNVDSAYIRRLAKSQQSCLSKFRLNLTGVKVVRYERRLAAKFEAVLTVSEQDRDELFLNAAKLKDMDSVRIVPNGVDLRLLDYVGPEKSPYRLISTGALTYNANYDATLLFCREILPRIQERLPEVQFIVTGSYDGVDVTPFVKSGAKLIGLVPDIRPQVAKSAALVVPLRFGGGTRLKILEAMALGTPVVSTMIGAMGIGAEPGTQILLADKPQEFADAVCRILTERDLARNLSENARRYVSEHFGWDSIAEKLETVLEEIVARHGRKICKG